MFEPERAHNIAEFGLKLLGKCKLLKNYYEKKNFISDERLHQKIFNVKFENPVGLAAGFDKNATMVKAMKSMDLQRLEQLLLCRKMEIQNLECLDILNINLFKMQWDSII